MKYLYYAALWLSASAVGIGIWYRWKRGGPDRAKKRRRNAARRLIESHLDCLQDVREIGVGHVGAAFTARLAGEWEKQLGILWKTEVPFPELVVVKICFLEKPRKRATKLIDLARKLEARVEPAKPLPLCPFLAIGMISSEQNDGNCVVEIMPFIKGEELREVLRREDLPVRESLQELVSVLKSALLLEELGYLAKGLDAENILVQPDRSWLRIDYDSLRKTSDPPLSYMIRFCRICRIVLENLRKNMQSDEADTLIARIRATERYLGSKKRGRAFAEEDKGAAISSPRELTRLVERLADIATNS